jgi:hypothetical protein
MAVPLPLLPGMRNPKMMEHEYKELRQQTQSNQRDYVEGAHSGDLEHANQGSAELIPRQPTGPPTAEVESEDASKTPGAERENGAKRARRKAKPRTKKDRITVLYEQGVTNVVEIAQRVDARPSYVAQVLQNAGLLTGYFDLYTTTAREQNVYSQYFRNVLSFKTVESARESVKRIDELYNHFEQIGDRAGQHQAMLVALTGKNRARWIGKQAEAEVFGEWLARH